MSERFATEPTEFATATDVMCELAGDAVLVTAGQQLQRSSYPQLWKIACEFHEGVLTLRGIVSSFFMKQLAHVAVADVSGVKKVANRLDVQYPMTANETVATRR